MLAPVLAKEQARENVTQPGHLHESAQQSSSAQPGTSGQPLQDQQVAANPALLQPTPAVNQPEANEALTPLTDEEMEATMETSQQITVSSEAPLLAASPKGESQQGNEDQSALKDTAAILEKDWEEVTKEIEEYCSQEDEESTGSEDGLLSIVEAMESKATE